MMCFNLFKNRSESAPDLGEGREHAYANSRKTRASKSAGSLGRIRGGGKKLRVFSLSELAEATSHFSRSVVIGRGGFGDVYKGEFKPVIGRAAPQMVAIKKLNSRGFQGHKQWVTEVRFLGVLDHPNLVNLLGYCAVNGERGIHRLLVYEYMPNRSLEDHLFNRSAPVVSWITRLKIMLGAAQGMAYLHEGLQTPVIHRDFKSSNVLLDKDFNAKLSDFGLAREGPTGDQTHVSTVPVGTHGYAAPEYAETGRLTAKSDVYSFGVVLYEILTGRRTLERDLPSPEQKLIEWVRESPHDTNRFIWIMDPRLQNAFDIRAARRIAQLADKCLSKNPKDRPAMSEVVEILQQALEESMLNPSSVPSKSPHRKNRPAAVIPGGRIPILHRLEVE